MKSDSSRDTFDQRRHFSSVRMQQGRVQLDSDWNEQQAITEHRVRAEAADVIGRCGGPLHHAAFHIVGTTDELSPEENALPGNHVALSKTPDYSDFLISAGHYYVDGILCENEQLTSYLRQPDFPGGKTPSDEGLYIVYLDVWQRHLTALEDPSIREIALGGPDTATRTKITWQVKFWPAGPAKGNCLTSFAEFDALIAPGDGTLSARSDPEKTSTSPCIVPPGAGYRGLENQFYRVEVHDGGAGTDVTNAKSAPLVRVANAGNKVAFTKTSTSMWKVGQAVEIFSAKAGNDPLNGTMARIMARDDAAKTLTLDVMVSSLTFDQPRIRPVEATYKWSRNNGAIVTAIESINGQEVTVHDLGPDAVLGFKEGQWVEISDDAAELAGQPGQLAQITKIDRAINLITLNLAPTGGVDKELHPRLRGWDGIGPIQFDPDSSQDYFLALEDGVQVRFFAGSYRSGDYWNIPARTATADTQSGNIEWPRDSSGAPLAQSPSGIRHHYCRLAMLRWDGKRYESIADCRRLFPPVTELTSLFYLGGDGQEGLPGATLQYPLRVGVANGEIPVVGATVRFTVIAGNGSLQGGSSLKATTDPEGVASCTWTVGPLTGVPQLVRAELIDATESRHHLPILFSARVFDPISIFYLGGDGQEGLAGAAMPYPLRVGVARGAAPVNGATVRFMVAAGGGSLQGLTALGQATTVADGVASCGWTIGPAGDQRVVAELIDTTGARRHLPIQFSAAIVNPTSLFYLGGDGQEGQAGAALRYPLRVGVARGVTPIAGATVRFSVAAGGGTLQGLTAVGQTLTGPDGVASCTWTLGPQTSPQQLVLAELLDGTTRRHLPIQFAATAIAGESGVHIVDVVRLADNKTLINDTDFSLYDFAAGIGIVCDDAIDPGTIRDRPTCFVTLELPVTNYAFNIPQPWNLTHYQPRVLAAGTDVKVVKDKTTMITWITHDATMENLRKELYALGWQMKRPLRLLARLTLKGNFIWSVKDPDLFLDGETFGLRRKPDPAAPTELRLPSGDRRRGGDFEMWFYLTFGELNPVSFRIASVDFLTASSAVIALKGSPPSFYASDNATQIHVKFNRAIGKMAGGGSAGRSVFVWRLNPGQQPPMTHYTGGTSDQLGADQIRIVYPNTTPLPVGQYQILVFTVGDWTVSAKDDGTPLDPEFCSFLFNVV